MRGIGLWAALVVVVLLVAGRPAPAMEGGIHVEGAWARPTLGGQATSAAYLWIANRGPREDALIGVTSPVAKHARLHTHVMDGSIARMRPVDAVELSVGKPVVFEPGAYHIMLTGLKRKLAIGDSIPLKLMFRHHAPLEIEVRVLVQPPSGTRGSHSGSSPESSLEQGGFNTALQAPAPAPGQLFRCAAT